MSTIIPNIDMNDAWTLTTYSQMVLFLNDYSRAYLPYENPSHTQQQIIQHLAHQLFGLEYEYNLLAHRALVSRPLNWSQAPPGSSVREELPTYGDNDWLDIALLGQSVPLSSHPSVVVDEPVPATQDLRSDDWLHSITSTGSISVSQFNDLYPYPESIEALAQGEVAHLEGRGHASAGSLTQAGLTIPDTFIHNQDYDITFINIQDKPDEADSLSNIPPTPYTMQGRRANRANSVNSANSHHSRARIGKIFSKTSSAFSGTNSMYSCFDSKSASRSAQSVATDTSVTSRRSRRPLDKFAKAAMKAVRTIGACWRCKLLRKSCSKENPCGTCPTGPRAHKSEWQVLGCQRGTLEDKIIPLIFCPAVLSAQTGKFLPPGIQDIEPSVAANINDYIGSRQKSRAFETQCGESTAVGPLSSFLATIDEILSSANGHSTPFAVKIEKQFDAELRSLEDCIQMILWELSYSPSSQEILGGFTMESLTALLRCAALHQVKTESDQLVDESLRNLRDSLEALHFKTNGQLKKFTHKSCPASACHIESVRILNAGIVRYTNALSDVFFQKEKMRKMKSWWLSVFYSLCIQNFVRQVLLQIFASDSRIEDSKIGAQQYHHLALRVFLAYSRKYDPLTERSQTDFETTMTQEDMDFKNEIMLARLAVKQDSWSSVGIKDSKGYLNELFEDYGEQLQSKADWIKSFSFQE